MRILIALFVCFTFCVNTKAQQKERFTIKPNATLTLNSVFADVNIEHWDKNEIEISSEQDEAYTASFKNNEVTINVASGSDWSTLSEHPMNFDFDFDWVDELSPDIQSLMADLPDMIQMDILEPSLHFLQDHLDSIAHFDFDAYKQDKSAYIKKYKQQHKKWEKAHDKMKEEREKLREKHREAREKLREKKEKLREERHKAHEERWEEWGKQMSERAKEFSERMKQRAERDKNGNYKYSYSLNEQGDTISRVYSYSSGNNNTIIHNGNVISGNQRRDSISTNQQKKINIKLPKDVKLTLKSRHGSLTLPKIKSQLIADLAFVNTTVESISNEGLNLSIKNSTFNAGFIEGGQVTIKACDQVQIDHLKNNNLIAMNCNLNLKLIEGKNHIQGKFGELTIQDIKKGFEQQQINVVNSNAVIDLPNSSFKIHYNGSRCDFDFPDKLKINYKDVKRSGTEIKGYIGSENAKSTIAINAKFSNVKLK